MLNLDKRLPASVIWRMRAGHAIIALGVIGLIWIAVSGLSEIANRERDLTSEAVPALKQAAATNISLGESLRNLEAMRAASSVEELTQRRDAVRKSLQKLSGLSAEFRAEDADNSQQAQREATKNLNADLDVLFQLSKDRLSSEARLQTQASERRQLLTSSFDLLQQNIVELDLLLEEALAKDRTRGEIEQDALLVKIRQLSIASDLLSILERVATSSEKLHFTNQVDDLDEIRASLSFELRSFSQLLTSMPRSDRRQQVVGDVRRLQSLLLDRDGAIETRKGYISAEKNLEQAWRSSLLRATKLVAGSSDELAAASETIKATSAAVDRTTASTRTKLLIAGFAALLLITAIVLSIVERQIIQRLATLSSSVREIASGNQDHVVGVSGEDELGEMAKSLAVFKRNAEDLWRTNAELAEIRSERELAAVNAGIKLVLDTATNGIIALDKAGRIVIANPVARHMLGGVSAIEPFAWPAGVDFLDAHDLSPIPLAANPVSQILSGTRVRDRTYVMTRLHGSVHRYVRISSAPVDDENSSMKAVVVIDDISEQETHRQQIERSSRLDALGQLTGGIAHDFNNLLATVMSAVQLALRLPASETERLLNTALTSIRRGSELTQRLLAFAKKQPGQATSRPVKQVISDLAGLAIPTIEANVKIVTRDVDPELLVFCDQGQLDNAMLNLILNARDAILRSGKGDTITIDAKAFSDVHLSASPRLDQPHAYSAKALEDDRQRDMVRTDGLAHRYVEITVTDNGPGMSEEIKRRAIDPFFTTKDTNTGTGLGLSMVYGFVQQAGGELRIYSDEGQGTTIRLLLPRGELKGGRESAAPLEDLVIGDGQRILLVEDEALLLGVISEMLTTLGYQLITAASGKEALRLVDDGLDYDLLLTDVVMPGGVGGFELAKALRVKRPNAPVIYMSGYTGFSNEEMGEVVAPLIAKPCEPAALSRLVREALQTASGT